MSRKAIFDAIRAEKRGIFDAPANIAALDALLEKFGIPRDDARRQINAAGLALIKESEGLRLTAYKDAVGVLTIGYGSTGAHVKPGMVITEALAEELLREDLSRFEDFVSANCSPATDNQFAAMVSLAFNVGNENLRTSTLRRKHLEGDYVGAAAEFPRWNKAGGKVLQGLVKRRAKEAQLYRTVS